MKPVASLVLGILIGASLTEFKAGIDRREARRRVIELNSVWQERLVDQQKRNESGTNRVFYAFNQDELQDVMARAQIGDVVKLAGSWTISNQLVRPGNNVTTNAPTEEFTVTNSYRVDFKRVETNEATNASVVIGGPGARHFTVVPTNSIGYYTNLTGTNIPAPQWPRLRYFVREHPRVRVDFDDELPRIYTDRFGWLDVEQIDRLTRLLWVYMVEATFKRDTTNTP